MNVLLIVIAFLVAPHFLVAQCGGGQAGCTEWTTDDAFTTVDLEYPDCNATIRYRTRTCYGIKEFYITGWSVNWGCEMFDPAMSWYGRDRNALIEYLTTGLIQTEFLTSSLPLCSSGNTSIVTNVYTASCGIWVCCEYTLPTPVEFSCPSFWEGDPPHFGTSPPKVKVCKWQSCGTQCCKRTYTLCRGFRSDATEYIKMTNTGKTPIGNCSGQGTYSSPCETDCR